MTPGKMLGIATGTSIVGGKQTRISEEIMHQPEIKCARQYIVARVVGVGGERGDGDGVADGEHLGRAVEVVVEIEGARVLAAAATGAASGAAVFDMGGAAAQVAAFVAEQMSGTKSTPPAELLGVLEEVGRSWIAEERFSLLEDDGGEGGVFVIRGDWW